MGALVNNAGGWLPGDQYPDVDADTWLSAITLNLLAPMLLAQLLWPIAVVTMGSSGGLGNEPYRSPECAAAKAGVHRFTASFGSRTDVRVMSVVPGWIGLDRAHHEWDALTPDQHQATEQLIPTEDISDAVATLLGRGRPGDVVEMLHNTGPNNNVR